MDELKLKLSTKFMRGIIAKFIAKALFKKFGCRIDVQINEIEVETVNGKIRFHANVDAEVDNGDFLNVIKTISKDEDL